MPGPDPFPLSVVIMTYNEETNIGRCLDSIAGVGEEILVLDSFSTDGTVEIALRYQARIEQHEFDTYVQQKSRMIRMASHDWVLSIDADEYLSPELRESIIKAKSTSGYDGYQSNRRNKIGDTWIHHGSWYPDRKIRMFDRRKVTIIGRDPHDVMQPVEGARIGKLRGDLLHHADESMSTRYQTIEKHSTRAAAALYANRQPWRLWRLIFKPCIRFIVSFFLRLGFLDGYYGWFIAKSEAQYVWMREMKLWEIWNTGERVKKE